MDDRINRRKLLHVIEILLLIIVVLFLLRRCGGKDTEAGVEELVVSEVVPTDTITSADTIFPAAVDTIPAPRDTSTVRLAEEDSVLPEEPAARDTIPARDAVIVMEVPVTLPEESDTATVETTIEPTTEPTVKPTAKPAFTPQLNFKTNALQWGLAISNVALEIDICSHLSFNLPVSYSAWNYFSPKVKFRTFSIQPELRYWFSDDNDGWFAGAHFGMSYYNIAVNGDFRMQDHAGKSPALGGGLSAGFRMPISKDGRWKVEFSLGAGAYGLNYDNFHNQPNGLLDSTVKDTYIGIDQASVSFSYSFNLKTKGGIK